MSDLIADNARFAKVAAPLFPLEHKTKLEHKSGDRGDDVGTVQVDVSGKRERDLKGERVCVSWCNDDFGRTGDGCFVSRPPRFLIRSTVTPLYCSLFFFSFTFSFVLSITICLGTCTKSSRRRCPRSRNTVFEQVEFSTTEALQPCS